MRICADWSLLVIGSPVGEDTCTLQSYAYGGFAERNPRRKLLVYIEKYE